MAGSYEIFGVSKTASAAEIQSAYRRLAKQHHPDLHPGDTTAEDRFKEVAGAYDLLGDGAARKPFDAGEIDVAGTERPPHPNDRDYAESEHARR